MFGGIIIIGIVFMVIGMLVSNQLKSRFRKYASVPIASGLSGAEVAERMLRDHNIHNVEIVSVPGQLTDHYNPMKRTINLSPEVYEGRSVAAAAVAAHETGHAVQHATGYAMLQMRSQMVPLVNISSRLMNYIFLFAMFGGVFASMWNQAILVIVLAQAVLTLFSLITLPVEFDASNRALAWLDVSRITGQQEHGMAKNALNWAASTYVVSALSAISYLLVFLASMSRD
ncbi:MAG: zinc metallopeptidase [Bacteroidota bacterium]